MEKDIMLLIELLDYFDMSVDPDGVCDNGCSCGECEYCVDLNDALHDFYIVKDKYKYLVEKE